MTFQNVSIVGNTADVSGAGVHMHGTGSLHAAATVVANNSCACISNNCFVEGVQISAQGLDSVSFVENSSIHLGSRQIASSGILLSGVSTISSLEDPSGGATLDCLPGKHAKVRYYRLKPPRCLLIPPPVITAAENIQGLRARLK